MPPPPGDVTAFADSLHALLGTSPPSLSGPASANSLPVLTQLLQPDFLNGSDESHSVWRALQQLPPPTIVSGGATTSLAAAAANHGAATSPHFVLGLTGGPSSDNGLDVLDDGSCCISLPLGATSAEQIELAPHSITLVEVPIGDMSAVRELTTEWWELPWTGGKKLSRGKHLMARKTFYPPKDKLSVLVAWWGYQVFLPEIIMKQLGSDLEPYVNGLSALSTALTFLASRAPTLLLLIPGGALFASLGLPIIAAISSACTFSWKYMKAKDKGEGIILAATWLIPMALIPRTLQAAEWAEKEGEPEGDGGAKAVLMLAEVADIGSKSKEERARGSVPRVSFAEEKQVACAEQPKWGLLQRVRSKGGRRG